MGFFMPKEITQNELKELLEYTPDSGVFVYKKNSSNRKIRAGQIAGWKDAGYLRIQINGKGYKAHRLAWLYMYGDWPKYHIDHIDHDRANNRISNLRDVTVAENIQNQIKANSSSKTNLLGVTYRKRDKLYEARIVVNRKRIYIGLFKDPKEAYRAYVNKKRELHKTCTL